MSVAEPVTRIADLDLGRVLMVGIGGAGQAALADILLDMGVTLVGSDLKLSATTEALAKRGATIYEGHNASNLEGVTLVVTTAAAQADNPELIEARRRGIEILSNAQMVGIIVNAKRGLAIAGTHGKTTTTNLVATLLSRAGLEPTYFIGGQSRDLGSQGAAGNGEFAVVEADEYAGRFLEYFPEAAIITNIEADHLDYWGDIHKLKAAFKTFAGQCGRVYLNADDAGTLELASELGDKATLYGLSDKAVWRAGDISTNDKGGHDFALLHNQKVVGKVSLNLPGLHNVKNATAALAMCSEAAPEVGIEKFCQLAGDISGTARRFEQKGVTASSITVIDDYAHHPTEIRATLAAARSRYAGHRIVALFQPHTYSRTRDLLDEFAAAFADADVVALMEIFASRESNTLGISTQDILARMSHPDALNQVLTHANATTVLQSVLQPGDILLTLGAGDVWKIGEELLRTRD